VERRSSEALSEIGGGGTIPAGIKVARVY
jgi:hypothetical protein